MGGEKRTKNGRRGTKKKEVGEETADRKEAVRRKKARAENTESVTSLLCSLTGVITFAHSPSPLDERLSFSLIASAVYLPLIIVSVPILIHPSRLHR